MSRRSDEINDDDPPTDKMPIEEKIPDEEQEQADLTKEDEFVSPAEALKGMTEIPQQSKNALAEAMTSAVTFTHHEIAVYTHFSQWELDPVETGHFQNFFGQIAPYIPIEYLGIIIGAVVIMMIEVMKIRAYMTFAKQTREAQGR